MIKTIEKYPLASLTLLVLLMLLTHINVPSVTIMEARNFITAREMIEDGNWLLTTMNGEPRYQKPPLPTWLTAISGITFGANNLVALRLPGVLMVLFSGFFVYFLSLKLQLSKNHSFRNSLLFVTSFYVIGIINEAPWDIYAHGFMLGGIYFLFQFFNENKHLWKYAFISAILFGLSILSKGPVSLFAVFLPFIIAYGISYKFQGFKKKVIPFIGFIILSIVLGSWWFLYVRYADPEAFLAIATRETGNWSSYNVKPFYYYWSFFVQSGLWTIPSFIGLLYPYLIKRVENKKAYKLTFWWTIIAVLLLSSIPEKKARYLMPVLIPLALNTGFYIQYLVQHFSTLKKKKETIPVIIHVGLIALIGVSFPVILYIVLKDSLQLFLLNYVLTSIVLVTIGVLLCWNLVRKNFKNTFYLSILFMASIFIFGLPISKAFNKNSAFNSIHELHEIEKEYNLKTYAIHTVTPEMIWDYHGKIKNIYENNSFSLPSENKFGLLVSDTNFEEINRELKADYELKFIKTYNLNVGSKQKERLIRDFYLVSKK